MIEEQHIKGFNAAVDLVARERKYIARTEGPSLEESETFVRNNGNAHYVALVDGRVVGWCDIVPMKKAVFSHNGVLGMGVTADYRGCGIGTALLRAALSKAKANGLERIELEVFHTNAKAIALYQKVGFRTEGTKKEGG